MKLKVMSFTAVGLAAAALAAVPTRAQDLVGAVAKMGLDPLVAICAANPCRKDIKITLKKENGSNYTLTETIVPPVIYNGAATLLPGDAVTLAADQSPGGVITLRSAAATDTTGQTIALTFEQKISAGKKPTMVLTITNPFDRPVRYQMILNRPNAKLPQVISSCLVPKKASSRRNWKGLVTRVTISNLKTLNPGDDMACN